jgi:hypothetical protein
MICATSGRGEPVRQQPPLVQVLLAHLRAADAGDTRPRRHLADLLVAVLVRQEHQLVERQRLHADFLRVLLHQRLRVIRAVERPARAVVARPGVVAPDDEMIRAMVAADDGMPHSLARARHAHRQRQQRQQHAPRLVMVIHQRLVRAHAGVMIDIAGLGHAHHRMQQQHAVHAGRRALGQFLVHAVQRVARLEGDHIGAVELFQAVAHLGGRLAQLAEVVVHRQVQHTDGAADVQFAPAGHLGHNRMLGIQRAIGVLRLRLAVRCVDFLNRHHRQQVVAAVAQGDVALGCRQRIAADGQRDRHREQRAVGQAHVMHHALVIGPAHEARQRRKPAGRQQFQVAHRAVGNLQRGQRGGVGFQVVMCVRRCQQVDKRAAIRRNQVGQDGGLQSAVLSAEF